MKKKYLIAILIICLLTLSITLGLFIPKYQKYKEQKQIEKEQKILEEKIKNAIIKVELVEDLNIPFHTKKKASELITSINGEIIEDEDINTLKVGKQEVEIKYINEEDLTIPYKFEVNIIDIKAPVVWLSGSYTVNVNYPYEQLMEEIMCGDDYDPNPKCEIIGNYNLNKVGNYKLKYSATDSSGNNTTKDFTLIVREPPKGGNSTYTPPKYTELDYILSLFPDKEIKLGIDISAWQGDVDFQAIKDAGIEFVFLRVGSNKDNDTVTMPDNFLDSKFKRNIEGFNEIGIPVGIYFFSYAGNEETAIRDAEWVLEQIKDYKVDLPIAYDWENWGKGFNQYHKSMYEITHVGEIFLDKMTEAGYKGILYGSINALKNFWQPIDYPIWVAHYTDQADYSQYDYWQIASNGRVPGIKGYCDVDVMYVK